MRPGGTDPHQGATCGLGNIPRPGFLVAPPGNSATQVLTHQLIVPSVFENDRFTGDALKLMGGT